MTTWSDIVTTTFRLLTFRSDRLKLLDLSAKHLAFGLLCTWLVGMGRYWDILASGSRNTWASDR